MKRYAITGFITLVIVVALAFFLTRLSNSLQYRNTYTLYTYVDSARGLTEDARVVLAGVGIGRMKAARLEESRVLLTLRIQNDIPIPTDSKVQIVSQSLLGGSLIEVIPGDSRGMLKEGEYFTQIGQGESSLNGVLAGLQNDMSSTLQLVDENLLLIQSMLLPLSRIIETVEQQTETQLNQLSSLLQASRDAVEIATSAIDDNDQQLQTLLKGLNTAIGNLNEIIAHVQQGEGNLGKLLHDEALYTSITSTVENLEEFTRTTIGPDIQIGYRGEVLTNFTTPDVGVKSHFDVRLVPQQSNTYYGLGIVTNPDNGNLRISAQIAKNFFDEIVTIRGGIIENSPGFGLDIKPIDQLEVSAEMFDFGQANNGGYLRTMVNIYPFYDPASSNPLQWLYLNMGADNILVNDRKYFLGFGMRFQENNIRSVALVAPSLGSVVR